MRQPRAMFLAVLLTLGVLNLTGAPGAFAAPAAPAAATGTAFTYQGNLKKSGQPVNATCSFQFSLWDATSAGSQQGTTQAAANVAVQGGLFTVQLDFGAVFTGEQRWLETAVQCAGDAGYTGLVPRQLLTAAPYALGLMPGSQINSNAAADALTVTQNGAANGIHGQASVVGSVAVRADNNQGIGLLGSSTTTKGVWGVSTSGPGVYGESNSGPGVSGDSGSGNGIEGTSTASAGYGVKGIGGDIGAGVYGESVNSYGVQGRTTGGGMGVYGSADAQGTGVSGTSLYGTAIRGDSANGIGVEGHSSASYGVHGKSETTVGVYGESTNDVGVQGTGGSAAGVHGTSTSAAGVLGESTSGAGVAGSSTSGFGVKGTSSQDAGVYGESTSDGGAGVRGISNTANGRGVTGVAQGTSGIGVFGEGAYIGVWGDAGNNPSGYAAYFLGNVTVTGNLSKGGGSFKIDHPLDPLNKYLLHSFVESPDMKNIYDGVVTLDAAGAATVQLPDWFQALNQEFRYQLTCIGGYAPVYVSQEVAGNQFKIGGGRPGLKVSWQVTGIRHDPYAEQNRIPVEQPKVGAEKGKYLYPAAYGRPASEGIAPALAAPALAAPALAAPAGATGGRP